MKPVAEVLAPDCALGLVRVYALDALAPVLEVAIQLVELTAGLDVKLSQAQHVGIAPEYARQDVLVYAELLVAQAVQAAAVIRVLATAEELVAADVLEHATQHVGRIVPVDAVQHVPMDAFLVAGKDVIQNAPPLALPTVRELVIPLAPGHAHLHVVENV